MPAEPAAELVDVLDDAGRVVGTASRRDMRQRRLPHRCAYLLVFNRHGELLTHLHGSRFVADAGQDDAHGNEILKSGEGKAVLGC